MAGFSPAFSLQGLLTGRGGVQFWDGNSKQES